MTTFLEQVQAAADERLVELQPHLDEAAQIRRTVAAARGEVVPLTVDDAVDMARERDTRIIELQQELEAAHAGWTKADEAKQKIAAERREARERIKELESQTDTALRAELDGAKARIEELSSTLTLATEKEQHWYVEQQKLEAEVTEARATIQGFEGGMDPGAVTLQERVAWALGEINRLKGLSDHYAAKYEEAAERPKCDECGAPYPGHLATCSVLLAQIERDDALAPELESAGKDEETPEHKSESAEEPTTEVATGNRRQPNSVTLEKVRDTIREHFPAGVKFNVKEVQDKMGTTSSAIQRHVKTLKENGTLERSGGLAGPNVKYEFVRPKNGDGPRERPRHAPSPSAAPDRANGTGNTVPGTGKPHGPAETPGKLKKQQAKAAPVKRQRVGGVRV